MIFHPTRLERVLEVEADAAVDERGWFARTWCQKEFAAAGLNSALAQCSISYNRAKGTLRGMHYQADPHSEAKLVRCTRGAIYDVALDLRPGSATFGQWAAAVLSAGNHRALYVPEGCAHGFLTLEDDSEVFYQISEFYHPDLSRGVRWNDPAFGIAWPGAITAISERDRSYPDFVWPR